MKPGIYDFTEKEYHADPCPAPSLSNSIAKVLLNTSPRHAQYAHPRLNPDHESERKKEFDIGSAAHSILLNGGADIAILDFPDYRTKASKEARDEAYAENKTPILESKMKEVKEMVAAAHVQLPFHTVAKNAFKNGKPEQSLIWQENTKHGDIWCRLKLDWLPNDPKNGQVFFDYKTEGQDANPDHSNRIIFGRDYQIQAAFYLRGIEKVLGIRGEFQFVVQEKAPPYCLSVIGIDHQSLDGAQQDVKTAIDQWGWCIHNDSWPGYPAVTAYTTEPIYREIDRQNRQNRHELIREAGLEPSEALMDWQAPLEKEITL